MVGMRVETRVLSQTVPVQVHCHILGVLMAKVGRVFLAHYFLSALLRAICIADKIPEIDRNYPSSSTAGSCCFALLYKDPRYDSHRQIVSFKATNESVVICRPHPVLCAPPPTLLIWPQEVINEPQRCKAGTVLCT